MFYYYGAKNRLVKHYPSPKYDLIIEPFAGSAAFSQVHGDNRRVILIEKDTRVVALWHRLLSMSVQEVLEYPQPRLDTYTDDLLIMLCAASNAIMKIKRLKVTQRVVEELPRMLSRIARLKEHCSHFEVICGDYSSAPDVKATWFVDSPYQIVGTSKTSNPRGRGYLHGADAIDFKKLSSWCQSRKGQVIVCEQEGASWLPFRRLVSQRSSFGRISDEMIWTNEVEEGEPAQLASAVCADQEVCA